jgi:dipeptidyl aminopeptidase/acylaminoacyl peptidase
MTRPNSDGRFDSQLRTFLAWQAGQVAGAPTAEEMASRVAASLGTGAGRGRVSARTVLWAAAVVALLAIALVTAAILAGRPRPAITSINGDLVLQDAHPMACALDGVDPATAVHRTLVPAPAGCGTDGFFGLEFQLSASTDGRRVAYTVGRFCGGCPNTPTPENLAREGVWLLDPGTGTSTKIDGCGNAECFMDAAVSPDGRLLAYTTRPFVRDEAVTLSIVDLGSGRKVTVPSDDAAGVRWSPDSSTLAFTVAVCEDLPACARPHRWIEATSANGSRTWTVFDDPTVIPTVADWTPDSTRVRFGAVDAPDGASPVTLHESVADGSGDLALGALPIDTLRPAWSPDGTRLAWLVSGGRTETASFVDLWVGSADGQNARRLFASGTGNVNGTGPTWSPDGRQLAFGYTVAGMSYTLDATFAGVTHVIGADGTGLHQVASVEGPLAWLAATSAPTSTP